MIWIVIIVVLYAGIKTIENKLLKKELEEQQVMYEAYIYQYKLYSKVMDEQFKNLHQASPKSRVVYRNTPIPDGVLDAVKIAMKVSHPDNGGKSEDFIKYNELYKKLSK